MTDTSPEALDALIDELRARAFAIQHNAAPETVRLLRVAAAALTAVRRGVNAMRADNARLREALANAVGALDAAGEDLSEFANILSREPNEANLTYQSARDAQDALALPLDAPAPTEPHKSVLDGNEAPAPVDTVRAQIETLHREACRVLSDTPDSLHAQGYEAGLQRAMMAARGFGDTPAVDPMPVEEVRQIFRPTAKPKGHTP